MNLCCVPRLEISLIEHPALLPKQEFPHFNLRLNLSPRLKAEIDAGLAVCPGIKAISGAFGCPEYWQFHGSVF